MDLRNNGFFDLCVIESILLFDQTRASDIQIFHILFAQRIYCGLHIRLFDSYFLQCHFKSVWWILVVLQNGYYLWVQLVDPGFDDVALCLSRLDIPKFLHNLRWNPEFCIHVSVHQKRARE